MLRFSARARTRPQVWPKTNTPASMVLFQQFGVQVRRSHLGARACLLVYLLVCLFACVFYARTADPIGGVSPVLVQIPSFQWKVVRATKLFPEDNGIIAWYGRNPPAGVLTVLCMSTRVGALRVPRVRMTTASSPRRNVLRRSLLLATGIVAKGAGRCNVSSSQRCAATYPIARARTRTRPDDPGFRGQWPPPWPGALAAMYLYRASI